MIFSPYHKTFAITFTLIYEAPPHTILMFHWLVISSSRMLAWLCLTLCGVMCTRLQRKYAHFAAYRCTLSSPSVLNAPITARTYSVQSAHIFSSQHHSQPACTEQWWQACAFLLHPSCIRLALALALAREKLCTCKKKNLALAREKHCTCIAEKSNILAHMGKVLHTALLYQTYALALAPQQQHPPVSEATCALFCLSV